MKKILFVALAAGIVLLFAACHVGNYFSVFDDDGDGHGVSTMETNDGNHYIKVKYTGDILITDDEAGIKSIPPGGFLKYWSDGKKLIALSNKDGIITYQLYDGSDNVSIGDPKGKKLMASVIKELINLGFGAKERVERLYANGGAKAVLDKVDFLKSDYVRCLYLEQMLNTKYLTATELNATAKTIETEVGGSYEKQQLLSKFAAVFTGNAQTSQAYFNAVKSIGGDYEKSSTLQAAFKKSLPKTALGQALVVANTIGGDYEKANVLKAVISKEGLGEENCDRLLDITGTIGGSYEKAGVLNDLIENDSLSDESFNRLLFIAGRIDGDYEKSGVFSKIAEQNIVAAEQWINLIKASEQINEAYQKTGVLVTIAKKMPNDEKVKAAYMDAAKTITSDYEYAQAVKATQE
jgi:hypothetical protein